LFSRYAAEIPIVHRSFIVPIHRSSFVHSPYSSFVQKICAYRYAAEIPIVRSSDHSIVRSFVHSSYSSFIVRSSPLFIVHRSFIRTIHHHYSHYYSLLLFTNTIYHRYNSSMISIITFSSSLFIITIHLSSDHPKFQLLIHHAVQST
jgi:hypothetical protein